MLTFIYPLITSGLFHPFIAIVELSLQLIFFIHAGIDAAHIMCVLFPSLMTHHLGDSRVVHLGDMYVSLFTKLSVSAEGGVLPDPSPPHSPLLRRVLAYWAAAMSITRLGAVFWPDNKCAMLTTAAMYVLEALSFEFEGITAATVRANTARIVSVFSLGIGITTLCLAIR